MRMLLLKSLWVLSGLCCLAAACGAGAAESRDLAGIWRFRIDRDDRGLAEEWHKAPLAGDATIRLPGTMQSQGFGDPISVETPWTGTIVDRSWFTAPEYEKYRRPGHFKVPFWLQPERYYKGAAWYQREIEVPAAWRGRRVVLTLERPHIETRAWLDDRELGVNNSLSTPHVRDLGTAVAPGKHRLTIRVDNRLVVDVGINSHSVTDHTQGNWNGIVGRIELSATPPVWVENLQVIPRSPVDRGPLHDRERHRPGPAGLRPARVRRAGERARSPAGCASRVLEGAAHDLHRSVSPRARGSVLG